MHGFEAAGGEVTLTAIKLRVFVGACFEPHVLGWTKAVRLQARTYD